MSTDLEDNISSEQREQEDCRKLLLAALNGDWENARAIIEKDPARMLSANLTKGEDKVIHIAVTAKRIPFIKQLVDLMSEKGRILNIQNCHGDTCLSIAAVSGKVEIAELIMARDNANQLLSIHGIYELIPLGMAIRWGHGEMAHYLCDKMELEHHSCLSSTTPDLMKLFIMSISNHLYDIALRLLDKDMEMACKRDGDQKTALHVLAQKAPDTDQPIKSGNWPLFSSSKKRIKFGFVVSVIPKFKGFCKQASTRTSSEAERVELLENILNELQKKSIEEISEILKSTTSEVVKTTTTEVIKRTTSEVVKTTTSEVVKITTSGVLFDAAMSGNVEFLDKVLRKFPLLIWENDEKDRSIFHVAIKYRQEKVFNLIYNIGAVKDYLVGNKDSDGNNMLHLAGMLPDDQERLGVQRANLQMQRELLWFKEVEKIVRPYQRSEKNNEGMTPKEVFIATHKNLVKGGQSAVRETASSCMLVSTIIASVTFAAVLTVPGASNEIKHTPFLRKEQWTLFFILSNAVALFTSATSIVSSLSVLTSSYKEKEFEKSLHLRLMFGLTTLFLSITAMLLAFVAAMFLIFDYKKLAWLPYLIVSLASGPLFLFLGLHFGLWADLIRSYFWSSFLFRPSKHRIFESLSEI